MSRVVIISLYDEFCLGPRYITSVLREAGHEAYQILFKHCLSMYDTPRQKNDPDDHLCNFYASKKETEILQDFIREKDPLWVGFSFMSFSSDLAVFLTEKVRQVSDAPIVWGGIDPTINPEWAIEHADAVCVGEGENASLELTEALQEKRDITRIQNLWIKQDGTVHKNEIRTLIQDLDGLPHPNFDESTIWHINQDAIYPGLQPTVSPLDNWYVIMTSRGCPYRCSYCIHGVSHDLAKGKGKYLRRRTVRNVIDELKAYKEKRPDTSQILFYDDVFTFDRKWIDEFADAYRREINIPFWVYTYPEMCDGVILKRLQECGLMYVKMGIQSGSNRVMKEVYHRGLNQDRILKAIETLQELNLYCIYDVLVGIPLEKEEDLRESLEFLLKIPRPFGLNVWPIIYYRNYNITQMVEQEGSDRIQKVEGANCSIIPNDDPYLRFWIALMGLTKYPQVSPESIRMLLENASLREDPAPLEEMEKALNQAVFIPNLEFQHKDVLIEKLQQENDRLRMQIAHLNNKKGLRLQRKVEKILGMANI
ncbi:MAG: B12-binding domain-containing radical SAM protein [Candidatus Omnitrophica bacterium]|nr:B12-binding domain-containing radical SAM protein [Candidatus Omnitrophota bacterium]